MFCLESADLQSGRPRVLCSGPFKNNTPINVKPAGGGGGRQGMGWGFDIFQKSTVKFPAHGQIIPVRSRLLFQSNATRSLHPGQHIATKYPKAEPKKGTMKLSLNKTLQSLLINVAASPKIHVPVTAAIIRFNHNPHYTA